MRYHRARARCHPLHNPSLHCLCEAMSLLKVRCRPHYGGALRSRFRPWRLSWVTWAWRWRPLCLVGISVTSSPHAAFRTVFEPVSKVTLGFAKAVRTAHEYGLDDAQAQARLAGSVADIISLWVHVPASRVTRDFIRGYEQFETGEGNFLSPIAPRPKSLSR
ncbi:hypothetical protein DVU_1698 [Nitratidesulfovibrio vulgaris str. Hildenborough]|uniref:Uncharacterized protein n=1 Tax=Nitratidesulfovibrio vulgaris (strain ATCC 29579 / DSM 644 / CCUG 34227 / NCIMB 8303 / VKM B-1760 / Hildenborough) TaxID=882 RepID=Q72BD8_NITV2|nr:hypothetical protein DVU_1698 [Nitratidesulfovibrio vulgaris str. Hildenborough]